MPEIEIFDVFNFNFSEALLGALASQVSRRTVRSWVPQYEEGNS